MFPQDTNYMPPMVFGGKMLSEMDIAAACAVRRFLYNSPTGVRDAVTVQVNDLTFFDGAEIKDLIHVHAVVIKAGIKSVDVAVVCFRENPDGTHDKMAEGKFRFVAYDIARRVAVPHGLKLPVEESDE